MNDAILSITRRAAQKPAASFFVELPFPCELLCKSVVETFRFTSQEEAAFASNRTARPLPPFPLSQAVRKRSVLRWLILRCI